MQKTIKKAKLQEYIQNFFNKTEKNPLRLYNCFISVHNECHCFNDKKKLRKIFDYSTSPTEGVNIDRFLINEGLLNKIIIEKWKQEYKESCGIGQLKYRYSDLESFSILKEILYKEEDYPDREPLEWLLWFNSLYMCAHGKQKTVSFVNKWIQFIIKEAHFEGLEINDKALSFTEPLNLEKSQ